jgi:hypothetical protein
MLPQALITMAHDVFVSHSAKDKTVSDALVAKLEEQGIRCWVAPRDVVPGADWGESIIDAIESSRIMVLIFSASANGSPQIKREIERAVDKGVYTIPFRIEDVQPTKALEYFISSAHWLDAFSQPLAQHFDSLARTLKAILATPRPGSAAEASLPMPVRSEPIPARAPETYQPPAQSPAPPPPPPPPRFVPQSHSSPAPAAAPAVRKTNWTPIIIGIVALVLLGGVALAGVLVYLFRAPATSTAKPKQEITSPHAPVSSSPPSTALAPPARAVSPPARTQSSEGIPSDKEIKKLVLDTLLLFNDAVQAKSFKAFYAKLGPAWKKETSPAKLQEIFHDFIDKHIDFSDIDYEEPTFDVAPSINKNGWLAVKGQYTLKTTDVLFDLQYENDQGSWKLVAIYVRTKPHP